MCVTEALDGKEEKVESTVSGTIPSHSPVWTFLLAPNHCLKSSLGRIKWQVLCLCHANGIICAPNSSCLFWIRTLSLQPIKAALYICIIVINMMISSKGSYKWFLKANFLTIIKTISSISNIHTFCIKMGIKLRKAALYQRLSTQGLAECWWFCREFHSALWTLSVGCQGILRNGLIKSAHNERRQNALGLKTQCAFSQCRL